MKWQFCVFFFLNGTGFGFGIGIAEHQIPDISEYNQNSKEFHNTSESYEDLEGSTELKFDKADSEVDTLNTELKSKVSDFYEQADFDLRLRDSQTYYILRQEQGFFEGHENLNESFLKSVPNNFQSGIWGAWDFCEKGSFATSLTKKIERNTGEDVDKTALNGIKMECRQIARRESLGFITSFVGFHGQWDHQQRCEKFLRGVLLDIKPYKSEKYYDQNEWTAIAGILTIAFSAVVGVASILNPLTVVPAVVGAGVVSSVVGGVSGLVGVLWPGDWIDEHDDLAGFDIDPLCDGEASKSKLMNPNERSHKLECPPHHWICGVRTQVEIPKKATDKTSWRPDNVGLTNVVLACCDYVDEIENCDPYDQWQVEALPNESAAYVLVEYSQKFGIIKQQSKDKSASGSTYHYHTIGGSLELGFSIPGFIKQKFTEGLKTSKVTGYNWSSLSKYSSVFQEAKEKKYSVPVDPYTTLYVYSIHGFCGPFETAATEIIFSTKLLHKHNKFSRTLKMIMSRRMKDMKHK